MQNVPGKWGLGVDVASCHNRLVFHQADGSDLAYLQRGLNCNRPLLCQVDAVRQGAAKLRTLFPRCKLLALRQGRVFTFGTLTGRTARVDSGELRAAVDELLDTAVRWWKSSRPGTHRATGELSQATGMYLKFEVTWSTQESRKWACEKYGHTDRCQCGEEGAWYHPHLHPLIVSPEPLDWHAMIAEWQKCGGGYARFMLLKACYRLRRGMITPAEFAGPGGVVRDLLELTKYTTKFGNMPPERVWEVFASLSNGQRVQLSRTMGELRMPEPGGEFADAGQPEWATMEFFVRSVYERGFCKAENPLGFASAKTISGPEFEK